MLDDKAPTSKRNAPSRGSSFYIENLLGTAAEDRVETSDPRVPVHSPVMCPGRLENQELNWRGTSPNPVNHSSRSECGHLHMLVFVCCIKGARLSNVI